MADAWSLDDLTQARPKPAAGWSLNDLTQQGKPAQVNAAPAPGKKLTPTEASAAAKPKSWAEVRAMARHNAPPPKDFGELPALWNMAQSFVSAPVGDVAGAVSSLRHGRSAQAFYDTRQKVIDALSLPEGEKAQKLSRVLGWPMARATDAAKWAAKHMIGEKAEKSIEPFATTLTDMAFARGLGRAGVMAKSGMKDFAAEQRASRTAGPELKPGIGTPPPGGPPSGGAGGGDFDRGPDHVTPPPGLSTEGGAKPTARRIEDTLYTNTKNGTADKIEARQYLQDVPEEFSSPEFQQRAYTEIERRMADSKAPLSPDVQRFMDGPFGKWYAEQRELYDKIKKHPLGKTLGADVDQGYVHRVVKGMGGWQDASEPGAAKDPIMGRGRTLSKHAPALEARKFLVLEDAAGKRTFVPKEQVQEHWEPGQTWRGSDGVDRTIKQATTEEIESNTPYRYHKNLLVNTVDNVLRLRRAYRNLETLDDLKGRLKQAGLMVDGGSHVPEGYKPTTLPQFMGAKLHPKIADVFDDFHGASEREGDSLKLIERVNRLAIGSLFWQPFSHIRNVGGHWLVGRGFDWITPAGLKSLAIDGMRAARSVMTQDEHYIGMLRDGAGLQYADRANANFYNLMLQKLTREQLQDRAGYWKDVAKTLGVKGLKDLVAAEYTASSKALWAVNDMFLMQRYFELMRKGMGRVDAIRQAEREIPNYRIPAEVMRSRFMSQVLRNPDLMAFGRYKYGQFKAYAETVKDLLGSGKSAAERTHALGQAMLLGLFGYGVYEYANPAVQKLTGNKQAAVYPGGPWAPLQGAGEMAFGWGPQQRDWASFISSVITPSPLMEGVHDITTGRDFFGRQIVNTQSPGIDQATQLGEYLAGKTGPGELAMQGADPGGVARGLARQIGGVKIPNPAGARGRIYAEKQEKGRARSFRRRDEIGKKVRETLRSLGYNP